MWNGREGWRSRPSDGRPMKRIKKRPPVEEPTAGRHPALESPHVAPKSWESSPGEHLFSFPIHCRQNRGGEGGVEATAT